MILGSHIARAVEIISRAAAGRSTAARTTTARHGGASIVIVTGNIFGRDYADKSGHFGPVTYWDKANTWRDNRFQDGTPVAP